jgi:primosomal protein N'
MSRSRAAHATASFLDAPALRQAKVATVALLRPLDKPYSYLIPPELEEAVRPGTRVEVPFGRGTQRATAICLSVSEQPWDSTLKSILECLDEEPVINDKLLALGQWIARYYCCPIGRTLDMMVPSAAKRHAGWKSIKHVRLARNTSRPSEADVRGFTTSRTCLDTNRIMN